MSGDTTLRMEYYNVSGDEAQSPYQHTGAQLYQDLNLRMTGSPEKGRYWEFNTSAVVNQSDYRHEDRGVVPEWVHLRYEDGTVAIPYRLDLGDQATSFTPLTLNQRLQAARVEMQPVTGGNGRHSVVWLSGRDSTDWNDPAALQRRYHGTTYHGASWLTEGVGPGRYSVNLLYQDPDQDLLAMESSVIASIAGAWNFDFAQQQLAAEAEWARLDEHGADQPVDSDQAMRLSLSGAAATLPMDYRLRYRRLGDGFRPLGTDLDPDSRMMGASAGVSAPRGVRLAGNIDRYADGVTMQRLLTDDYGVTLKAPATFGMVGWMDQEWGVRIRDRENDSGSIRDRATEAHWTVRVAGSERSDTRMAARWLGVEDDSPLDRDRQERRLALSHAQRLSMGPLDFTATPGVDYRHRTGTWPMTLVHPTLRLDASHSTHTMGLVLGYRGLERRDALMDIEEYSVNLNYRVRMDRHVFGLEYDQLLREPEVGTETESWRAGMFWRYEFQSLDGWSMAR
ncbi:MAG: hypothetical protein LAT50_10700 [Ectothiorhodospiraceae bacterium]|nr:hypothetical protein [Ectothiorhodospiraceae bacterium]